MAVTVRGKYSGEAGKLRFYDTVTNESIFVTAPVWFCDDFLGQAIDTTVNWTLLDTAGGAETLTEDDPNGSITLALTNANEAQLAGIYQNDKQTFTLNHGVNFECRMKLTVVPTGNVILAAGMIGATNAAVDSIAWSAIFRLDGSGAVTVETDDGTHETSKVSTGTTMSTTSGTDSDGYHVFRIDLSDYADVKFYIDGSRVASTTTFNVHTTTTQQLQPCIRIGKEGAEASVGTAVVDYVKVWSDRRP